MYNIHNKYKCPIYFNNFTEVKQCTCIDFVNEWNVTGLFLVVTAQHSGHCPVRNALSAFCQYNTAECVFDSDCMTDEKCCSATHYAACVSPAEPGNISKIFIKMLRLISI